MWIILWNRQPTFWFSCGSTFTVGRAPTCDITLQDDSSISRVHMTCRIGFSPGFGDPGSLTIVNSSKYGVTGSWYVAPGSSPSAVNAAASANTTSSSPSSHSLTPKEEWRVPVDRLGGGAVPLTLDLGNHGCQLVMEWRPMPCIIKLPEVQQHTKAGGKNEEMEEGSVHHKKNNKRGRHGDDDEDTVMQTMNPTQLLLASAGAYDCGNLSEARAVVCKRIEATASTVAALCCAVPFVGPHHFEAIRNRMSAKVPPPELCSSTALPKSVSSTWSTMLSANASATSFEVTANTFLPDPQRRRLFSGVTFVCFQEVLYKELSQYVKYARGTVAYEAFPSIPKKKKKNEEDEQQHHYESLLEPYVVRHQRHCLLWTDLGGALGGATRTNNQPNHHQDDDEELLSEREMLALLLPSVSSTAPGSGRLHGTLRVLEYAAVVRAVLEVKRPPEVDTPPRPIPPPPSRTTASGVPPSSPQRPSSSPQRKNLGDSSNVVSNLRHAEAGGRGTPHSDATTDDDDGDDDRKEQDVIHLDSNGSFMAPPSVSRAHQVSAALSTTPYPPHGAAPSIGSNVTLAGSSFGVVMTGATPGPPPQVDATQAGGGGRGAMKMKKNTLHQIESNSRTSPASSTATATATATAAAVSAVSQQQHGDDQQSSNDKENANIRGGEGEGEGEATAFREPICFAPPTLPDLPCYRKSNRQSNSNTTSQKGYKAFTKQFLPPCPLTTNTSTAAHAFVEMEWVDQSNNSNGTPGQPPQNTRIHNNNSGTAPRPPLRVDVDDAVPSQVDAYDQLMAEQQQQHHRPSTNSNNTAIYSTVNRFAAFDMFDAAAAGNNNDEDGVTTVTRGGRGRGRGGGRGTAAKSTKTAAKSKATAGKKTTRTSPPRVPLATESQFDDHGHTTTRGSPRAPIAAYMEGGGDSDDDLVVPAALSTSRGGGRGKQQKPQEKRPQAAMNIFDFDGAF